MLLNKAGSYKRLKPSIGPVTCISSEDFKNGTPIIFQRSNLNKSSRLGNELGAA